jgi:hypothetical protein
MNAPTEPAPRRPHGANNPRPVSRGLFRKSSQVASAGLATQEGRDLQFVFLKRGWLDPRPAVRIERTLSDAWADRARLRPTIFGMRERRLARGDRRRQNWRGARSVRSRRERRGRGRRLFVTGNPEGSELFKKRPAPRVALHGRQ